MRLAHGCWLTLLACGARSELDGAGPAILVDAGSVDSGATDAVSFDALDSSDASPSSCLFSAATILATDPVIVRQIAMDETTLYFVRIDGTIWSVPKAGGTASLFANADTASTVYNLSTFAMNASFLYYESATLKAIVRRPKLGGSEVVLGPTVHEASMVKGSNALYAWSFFGGTSGEYSLVRVPLAGGPSSVVTTTLPQNMTDIVVDGDVAYLATRYALIELSLVDGSMISHSNVSALHLTMDATHVYASAYPKSSTPIFSFLKANGAVQTVTTYGGSPNEVVLDGPWLYFGDQLGGLIHRVPAAGGAATEDIGFPYDAPNGMVIDGDCIYWGGEEGVFVAPK